MPSRSRLLSKARRVESYPCSEFHSLVVTKTSSRPRPAAAIAAPLRRLAVRDLAPETAPTRREKPAIPRPIQNTRGMRRREYRNRGGRSGARSAGRPAPKPDPRDQPFDADPEQADQQQRQADEGDDAEPGRHLQDDEGDDQRQQRVGQQRSPRPRPRGDPPRRHSVFSALL